MVPQNTATGIRFEPGIRIENRGNTPARNIRFSIAADVLPFPLPEGFDFPLPVDLAGRSKRNRTRTPQDHFGEPRRSKTANKRPTHF